MMAIGTNKDVLGKTSKFRDVSGKAGRPKVNRELVIQYLKAQDQLGNNLYSKTQVSKLAKCSYKTVSRIYSEAVEEGLIVPEDESKAIGIVEADFDSECQRAKGYSFKDWVETKFKRKSQAVTVFNFCSLVWEKLWNRCDMVQFKDDSNPLADQCAITFVTEFQEDSKRMRSRLKQIRYIFRFIGRTDVMNAHLTMSNSKHPRAKRRVPHISEIEFGIRYAEMEEELRSRLGNEAVLDLRLKIATQMRTGDLKDERELWGIKKGMTSRTYLNMRSPDEYQFHVFAKKGEEWDVIWMPREVKDALWERYQKLDYGDQVAISHEQKLRDAWGDISEETLGFRLNLHDCRKISLTWLYVMGVPLEVATMMNVGWKDLSTAHGHYLEIKSFLRGSVREQYRANIPAWFKEGLDDFVGFEAMIPQGQSSALGAIQGTGVFR